MDLDKQNQAIAEACGWKFVLRDERPGCPKYPHWRCPAGWLYSDSKFAKAYLDDRGSPVLSLPDYVNSLDAMHEAESVLDDELLGDYVNCLRYIVGGAEPRHYGGLDIKDAFIFVRATAMQRAEAFLKAVKKWKN